MLVNAFNCLLGALAEVIVWMTVADVFFVHERGIMKIFRLDLVCGLNLGSSGLWIHYP